ncbi:MAG TPA: DEAD/DEAH box helicase [Alphaproteobacteria bacterium]|nr:DEAD/DEAH box helicase [Alphaproteobacteria bacterium]
MVTLQFTDLALSAPILRALETEQYRIPTPIQAQAIPHLRAGRDLLGVAQTGTGKTAAFALPILERLADPRTSAGPKYARALILTPTRELAIQIGESFRSYGRYMHLRHAVIFGGVGQNPQVDSLRRGVDIVIATPGRLLDLMGQGHVKLDRLSILVLDEADRMLDMGFIRDIRKIVAALPKDRQTLLFSATMPADIAHLAQNILRNPIRVEVTPVSSTVESINQRVLFVDAANKRALLASLLKDPRMARTLVFTRTKHGANRVVEYLDRNNIRAEAIHGNKSQSARQRALDAFRAGRVRVLVATDIAARGIDIEGVSHVINFDLPNVPESYVHRIGRTARAGASGTALAFCDASERGLLRDIERLTKRSLSVVADHPFVGGSAKRAAGPAPANHRGERKPHQPEPGAGNSPGQGRMPRRQGASHGQDSGNRADTGHRHRAAHRRHAPHRHGAERQGSKRRLSNDAQSSSRR